MIWSTSTLGEVHLARAQALHSEQQQVLIHGVLLDMVVTMVVATHGVET
jgi:hypothetical protein